MARAYAALILIGFVWGSNFIFIKMATEVLPPLQVVFLRVVVGFVPLALVALWTGAIRRDRDDRHAGVRRFDDGRMEVDRCGAGCGHDGHG